MQNPIAIIGAMQEEVEALRQALTVRNDMKSPFTLLSIAQGSLQEQDVIIVRCGVGKVNAALATQYVIDHFQPRLIINSGVAGGVSPKVRISDVVIGTHTMHHDFDVQMFGYPKGTIPGFETGKFAADPKLVALASQAAKDQLGATRVHEGLIVSGDQFVSSAQQKQAIRHHFPEAICVEMEGAAIAQVASVNHTPHLIVRAISDQADNTAPDDFEHYLANTIADLNRVIEGFLALIKSW